MDLHHELVDLGFILLPYATWASYYSHQQRYQLFVRKNNERYHIQFNAGTPQQLHTQEYGAMNDPAMFHEAIHLLATSGYHPAITYHRQRMLALLLD